MSGIINKEIKLFGRKISLLGPDDGLSAASSSSSVPGSVYADESSSSTGLTTKCSTICLKEAEQDKARKQVTENVRDGDSNTSDESTNSEFQKPQISPDLNEEPKAVPETSSSSSSPKSSTTVASQDKTALKKPDKILPCPRCNSKDTKFCYYNNYNVNQPRHYCKKCQRYWTAGGTTRDIPVGAGRRKNKSSSSNRHLLINSTNPATILSFGSSSPPSTQIPPNGFYSMDHNLTGNLNLSNQIKGFLPPQVTFPPQLSWPYLSPVQFYAAPPAYYSCKIPILPLQDSTSLGKHSRDGDTIKTARECKDSERKDSSCKSLRINDDEQNKTTDSSIWSTIGREAEKTTDGIRKRGFFQGFELTGVNLNHDAENSSALEANPAAFSRSLKFRECNNRT